MPTRPAAEAFSYDPELTPGYFIQIRADFVRYGGFTPAAKVLYEVLLTYAADKETAWPGQVRLAEHLGVSERTIRNLLTDELIPAGLVSVRRPGQGHPNQYHLHKLPLLQPKVRPADFAGLNRHRLPIKNGTTRRSTPAPVAAEIQSDQIQTDEVHAPSPRGPSAFDVQADRAPRRTRPPGD